MQQTICRAYNLDWGKTMFQSKFDDLLREKEYRERRRIPIRKVAEESGLSVTTIQRLKSGRIDTLNLSSIERVCRYFNVQGVGEVIEYVQPGKDGE